MLPLLANADAVQIDGIYYLLNAEDQTAEVASNPNKYSGVVAIPESVTYEEVSYSVTSISKAAFQDCSGLTSITIPNSVTSISDFAFWRCSALTSITIPNSVISIGYGAFGGTAWFDNQPDGIVYAGLCAYVYKGQMLENTTISLKEGTIGIADQAFYSCRGLKSVNIPNSVTSIGLAAFEYCSSLTSVTIPNSVTSIDDWAFAECSALTSLTIPNSVTFIGNGAFSDCKSLTTIVVDSDNPIYDSRDNCNAIIETASNSLIAGCKTTVIPNSVTSIGHGAFLGCSGLTSITIPNSVISIELTAFCRCLSLTSVTIPNSVTSIGESAFFGCSSLTFVTISNSVTSIGRRAFSDCSGLTSVTSLAATPPQARGDSFSNYDIPLYVPTGARDAYLAQEPWNKFKEIVEIDEEDDVEVIKISSALQTTYCSENALDFTGVEGIKAYVASGYDRDNGTIWLMRVFKVPAKEGILLMGDEGEYKVPRKSTNTYYANFMKGTLGDITINETEGEYTNYYLSNGTSGVGFYKVNGSIGIKAHRAYLPLLKGTTQAGTRFIGIEFGDGTTNLTPALSKGEGEGEWYTLQGQRVMNPGKGLYIHNGKKVVIK